MKTEKDKYAYLLKCDTATNVLRRWYNHVVSIADGLSLCAESKQSVQALLDKLVEVRESVSDVLGAKDSWSIELLKRINAVRRTALWTPGRVERQFLRQVDAQLDFLTNPEYQYPVFCYEFPARHLQGKHVLDAIVLACGEQESRVVVDTFLQTISVNEPQYVTCASLEGGPEEIRPRWYMAGEDIILEMPHPIVGWSQFTIMDECVLDCLERLSDSACMATVATLLPCVSCCEDIHRICDLDTEELDVVTRLCNIAELDRILQFVCSCRSAQIPEIRQMAHPDMRGAVRLLGKGNVCLPHPSGLYAMFRIMDLRDIVRSTDCTEHKPVSVFSAAAAEKITAALAKMLPYTRRYVFVAFIRSVLCGYDDFNEPTAWKPILRRVGAVIGSNLKPLLMCTEDGIFMTGSSDVDSRYGHHYVPTFEEGRTEDDIVAIFEALAEYGKCTKTVLEPLVELDRSAVESMLPGYTTIIPGESLPYLELKDICLSRLFQVDFGYVREFTNLLLELAARMGITVIRTKAPIRTKSPLADRCGSSAVRGIVVSKEAPNTVFVVCSLYDHIPDEHVYLLLPAYENGAVHPQMQAVLDLFAAIPDAD